MATLSAIAERLGISEATVSNALSGKGRMKPETRELIINEAKKDGYHIHHTIKNASKRVIIVSEEFSENNAAFLQGLAIGTREVDLYWPVYGLDIWGRNLQRNGSAKELRPLINNILDQLPFRPSGMIYVSQYPRKIPGLFDGLNFPVVAIQLLGSGADVCVNFDNQQGGYEATRYMASIGRQRIAMLSGDVDTYSASERMIGYQRALIDSNLPYLPKLIWIGDWSVQSGYDLTQRLLDMTEPPDAIFAQNDGMAEGALKALRERGLRVPVDVALIGFDNTQFADFVSPKLSSLYVPRIQMGITACQKMCELLSKKKVNDVVVPCELVLRESC